MKKKIWTEEKITGEILKVVELLNLERMPSLAEYQINASGGYDALIRYGGMKHFSKMVNLPVERKIRQKEDSCIPVKCAGSNSHRREQQQFAVRKNAEQRDGKRWNGSAA